MKNTILFLLLICITFTYCTQDQSQLDQESDPLIEMDNPFIKFDETALNETALKDKNDGTDGPGPKECCEGSSLIKENITPDGPVGTCCRYRFTFHKGENANCEFYLNHRAPVAGSVYQNSNIIRWESEICAQDDGSCNEARIMVIADRNQTAYVCARETIATDCPCPYTYDQGIGVGHSVASSIECDKTNSKYLNTIRDFRCMCPSYVEGFMQGFELECDGCENVPPDCYCVSGMIVCP